MWHAKSLSRNHAILCQVFLENGAVRADRLVSVVLLLRQRGRLTAGELAAELEVSTRTVLRDMEALSAAGVPVYADRGRHGGFSLLPGFRTELTGLSTDEALALMTATSSRGRALFGLSPALTSAMRKVVDALPAGQLADLDNAGRRLLLEPDLDLLSRRRASEVVADEVLNTVRRAVIGGYRLSIEYLAPERAPRRHTVDPIGLVTARGRTYLLATRSGADRTYRLSRMLDCHVLPEPANRPLEVDLELDWAKRRENFLAQHHLRVVLRVAPARIGELLDTARAVHTEGPDVAGWVRVSAAFQDLRHAVWALWQLDTDVVVVAPDEVRSALHTRAVAVAELYAPGTCTPAGPQP